MVYNKKRIEQVHQHSPDPDLSTRATGQQATAYYNSTRRSGLPPERLFFNKRPGKGYKMFTQEQIIEAVQTVLKDHKEEQEKHPSPSWPASSMQDAVEAADAEALDHGIRYGLDLLLQNLGIPEFVSQHLVGLQDSLKEAEFIKREYPELYQRYQEKGLIDQLSEAVGQ